jgi:two-component system CheB/CheR fusion protein
MIAIGLAKLFGYELPINFKSPYISRSITEFWRRWHISLSTWLRSYLYIPLGGNRLGPVRTYVNLFLVMFIETAPPVGEKPDKARKEEKASTGRGRELELGLQYMRQRLQSTNEEMQASREEFTSMNEELQAANEELTASKEEMQSLNEELLTVNSELQAKIADLTRTNSDMKNLLDSTDIATIFLYKDLKIRNFTPAASNLIKLIPADVGRSITDIASKITSDDIVADATGVIKTLITVDKQIRTNDGHWYAMRIMPYRTVEDVFDGVVITFNDISSIKALEETMTGARDYAENIVNTVRDSLIILNPAIEVISANRSFYDTFKVTPRETVGQTLFAICGGQWNIPELRRLLEDIVPRQKEIYNYIVEHDFPHIGHQVMVLNARQIMSPLYKSELILLAIENVSKSIEIEKKVKISDGRA